MARAGFDHDALGGPQEMDQPSPLRQAVVGLMRESLPQEVSPVPYLSPKKPEPMMKRISLILVTSFIASFASAQVAEGLAKVPDATKPLLNVEATCGECKLKMHGEGCDLAVRLPEGSYYVDGAGISSFGHPHDENGFCLAIRRAEVQGEVVDGRFKASYFKLLPPGTEAPKAKEK
mgnify:FL=1